MLTPGTVEQRDIAPDLSYLTATYFGFHLAGGHIGLPILVLLFLCSKHVQRPATVINFCVTWIIYSVSYCLLIYGGHHRMPRPPFQLCLIQTSMIHGAPAMSVMAGLEVVLQAWTTFMLPCQTIRPAFLTRIPKRILQVLIILPPYAVFFLVFSVTYYVASKHPEDVAPQSALHCTIVSDRIPFQRFVVPIFCGLLMTAIVIMEVAMIVQYYRSWRFVKKICPLVNRRPSLSPWFRVTIFTVYSIATLGTCFSYLSSYVGPLPYMIQAALPLVATLVFGSQSDILRIFVCCYRKLRRRQSDCNDIPCTPYGGWTAPTSQQMSPHLTGHLPLDSDTDSSWRCSVTVTQKQPST